MIETLALDRLPEGQGAHVTELQNAPPMRRRLADLGLIPGTYITCLFHSPAGDPAAYQIRGAVIALRRCDATCIQVTPCPVPACTDTETFAQAGAPWA